MITTRELEVTGEQDRWFGGDGKEYTYSQVLEYLQGTVPDEVHIGSDSHLIRGVVVFASAICVFKEGVGNRYFIRREKHKVFPTLRMRLHKEVFSSVHIANSLKETFPEMSLFVHADLNPNPVHRSNSCFKELTNYIKAMGFDFYIKPDAWASCSVADKHAK
jgi:hypothetical protein